MGWSFQVGKLFGIPLRVSILFIVLLVALAWFEGGQQHSTVAGLIWAGYIASLFFCVVLHELGHSLVARRYGVGVSHIVLWPIGGVSVMERIPDNPRQEFNIAIAGPLVSVAIAVVLGLALLATGHMPSVPHGHRIASATDFLVLLAATNLFLAAFNLVPAFPMDGGRILRSLLAQHMDYARATHIAATIGQTMAFVFFLLGLVSNIMLLVIAVFIYLGAGQEEQQVQVRHLLRNVPVGSAMASQFATMTPDETIGRAAEEATAGYQQDFPVVDPDSTIAGLVTRTALVAALYERGAEVPLREIMHTDFCRAQATDSLADLFDRMSHDSCPVVVVVDDDHPVGLVTPERVVQYLRLMSKHPYQKGA